MSSSRLITSVFLLSLFIRPTMSRAEGVSDEEASHTAVLVEAFVSCYEAETGRFFPNESSALLYEAMAELPPGIQVESCDRFADHIETTLLPPLDPAIGPSPDPAPAAPGPEPPTVLELTSDHGAAALAEGALMPSEQAALDALRGQLGDQLNGLVELLACQVTIDYVDACVAHLEAATCTDGFESGSVSLSTLADPGSPCAWLAQCAPPGPEDSGDLEALERELDESATPLPNPPATTD